MMNRCAYQQNALGVAGYGEMRRGDSVSVSISGGVVCPKPRRLGLLNPCFNDPIRPPRWHSNGQQTEVYDSKAGTELLDMILTKGGYGVEKPNNSPVPSSPPFFCGSPPSRASNPVIQDAQFGNDRLTPVTPVLESSLSSSTRKSGGCVRVKFGQKPVAVRVEGFNCRGNCSISAVA